jgi:hypothetical protein
MGIGEPLDCFMACLRAPRKIVHSALSSQGEASCRNASRIMRSAGFWIFRGALKMLKTRAD